MMCDMAAYNTVPHLELRLMLIAGVLVVSAILFFLLMALKDGLDIRDHQVTMFGVGILVLSIIVIISLIAVGNPISPYTNDQIDACIARGA